MKRWHSQTALSALVLALGVAAAPARADSKLILNGKVASDSVRTVNGAAYVRLSDVAKALGLTLVKRGDTYELTKAGGAGQIEGAVKGKIGDQLFDGRWRFQVLSIQTVASYALKTSAEPYDDAGNSSFDSAKRVIRPKSGNTLVVVQCRVANGQKSRETLWIAQKDSNTALTDTQGESYPPSAYDTSGAPIQTKALLPGSKIEFPVVFSVPQGTPLQDLVFTLRNNNFSQKGNDVRVSLK